MQVEAVAIDNFIHDEIRGVRGRIIQPLIERSIAEDLERAGLCRIKMPKLEPTHYVADTSGKAPGDGQGQPSPLSQPAPLSPAPTLPLSVGGRKHRRSRGG